MVAAVVESVALLAVAACVAVVGAELTSVGACVEFAACAPAAGRCRDTPVHVAEGRVAVAVLAGEPPTARPRAVLDWEGTTQENPSGVLEAAAEVAELVALVAVAEVEVEVEVEAEAEAEAEVEVEAEVEQYPS